MALQQQQRADVTGHRVTQFSGAGSVNNSFGIKGVMEHCFTFKSIEDAVRACVALRALSQACGCMQSCRLCLCRQCNQYSCIIQLVQNPDLHPFSLQVDLRQRVCECFERAALPDISDKVSALPQPAACYSSSLACSGLGSTSWLARCSASHLSSVALASLLEQSLSVRQAPCSPCCSAC